jgi:hypothetical protein
MDMNELFFKQNVGGFDLIFRALFGTAAIIVLAMDLVAPCIWQWVIAIIAFVGLSRLFCATARHTLL